MAIDGTYGFVYCGSTGLGVGVFCVRGDRFEGLDYAGGRYEGIANARHLPNVERPEQFNRIMMSWLAANR